MKMNVKIIIVILLSLRWTWRINGKGADERRKRQSLYSPPLVYPNGGIFKLLAGVAVPIALPGRTLVFGQNFQFQYAAPPNASFFTDFFSRTLHRRRRRENGISLDRQIVYEFFESEFERRGLSGRDCLKRSICEATEIPLKEEGLVGELLEVLLAPIHKAFPDNDYSEAMKAGKQGVDCLQLYSSCPHGYGILDHISRVNNFDHGL
ncbi:uncharacterized protein LOC122498816 [Leptopilina heterotoma]|uniref:uncharacterized protein LOC122498816 n=1 Tax=Leptopilina heterotoma TaxID=63436 RepID=UPI001CAA1957|nr:uncharacterized protein LOC122498816 [Leptopilina heterotoma]XP_043462684.1 uncharacterized protein LOC122498816 [Leptopilina heterotoma]